MEKHRLHLKHIELSHGVKMEQIVKALQEAYHIIPISLQYDGNCLSVNEDTSKNENTLVQTVFLYCISPIVFNQQYLDADLNSFAQHAGFLPRYRSGPFDPEDHDSAREEACYKMVNAAHTFIIFMFSLLREGRLGDLACRVFRGGSDNTKVCLEESRKLCKEYVLPMCKLNGHMFDEQIGAIFAITLAVVVDTSRWEIIIERFRFLQNNAANDCRRFAELAKEHVKKADYDSAISLYQQSIHSWRYDHFTYSNLAQIYLKTKKYQFAQWCAHRAIWIDHSWPKSHYRFIQALDCQGHLVKALNLSAAVAFMAENSTSFFTGGRELLLDLIKQRDSLGARVKKMQSLPVEPTPNHKKKRVKSKSGTTTVLSLDSVNKQKDSVKQKSEPPVEDLKGTSTASKAAVSNNMPSVPGITSSSRNVGARECIDQSNSDVNLTKQKPVKNVTNGENEPPQVLGINNGKGGKAKVTVQNFNKYLQEGSEALIMLSYKNACTKYSLALAALQAKGKKALGLSELNIIVLKYCFAKACVGKGANEDIYLGLKTLDEIINDHYTISFPLAYYGKAVAFIAQNRYKEAKDPLKSLISIIDNKIKLDVYEFPNCESKIIEESHPEKLQELVMELTSICNAPPPPNAICRYITNDNSHRSEIYFSDPEFQGFAQVICHERCHLSYHMPCWKEIKEDKKLYFEKDFLGKPCFTPDCNSNISRIELFGADGMRRKMFPSEDDIKLKLKDNVTSKQPKETKKTIKPMVKKSLNLSHERPSVIEQNASDRLMVHRQSDSSIEEKRNDFAVEDTRQNADMILQKKFSGDGILQAEKKKQPKKSKPKEVLPLDFAKPDDPRIEQLKSIKVAAELDLPNAISPRFPFDPANPFAQPWRENLVGENLVEMENFLQQSLNNESRAADNEMKWNFIKEYGSMKDEDERRKWLQEYFHKKSNAVKNEDEWNVTRKPEYDRDIDDIESNNTFSKKPETSLSETNAYHKFFVDGDVQHYIYSDEFKSKPHERLPPNSLAQALDLALEDYSPSGTEAKPKLKRSSSFTSLDCDFQTKASERNDAYTEIMNDRRQTNSLIEQLESINNNCQNDKFSVDQGSSSESSNTDDMRSDNMQKHIINLINAKYKSKFGAMDNENALNENAGIRKEFCSQPKLSSRSASVTGSRTAVNGADTSHNGYHHSEKISKSFDAIDNEEPVNNCIACLKHNEEIEILKENYLLVTSQCQDLKDKLVQSQNELLVTKKATEREISYLKEELEKYEKQYTHIQSTLDTNTKKLDAEKRKLNAEVKTLTEKISSLNFEKDELVAEQSKLNATISLKHTAMEEERKLRFKAEDDIKIISYNLDAMEANYKQVESDHQFLIEQGKSKDIKIAALISQIDVMQKNLQIRFPPPDYQHMNIPRRPMHPGHYMPMMPPPPLGDCRVRVLPPSIRQIYMPRNYSFRPYTDMPLPSPNSNEETEVENNTVTKTSPTFNSPAKSPSPNDPAADAPSSPRHVDQFPSMSSHVSKVAGLSKSHSVESLHVSRSVSRERTRSVVKPLYAAAAAMESKQDGLNTSRDKLMHVLHKEFPTISKSGLTKYVLKIRSKHSNSLSGMPLSEIVHEIRAAIFEDTTSKGAVAKDSGRQWPPSTKSNSMGLDRFDELPFSWGVPESRSGLKRYYGDSDECYICYELLDEGDLHSLSCGHAYHSECIKRWLEVDKTCPTCRLYAPLEEEYPMLQ